MNLKEITKPKNQKNKNSGKNLSVLPTTKKNQTILPSTEYSWIEIVKHDRPGDCWVVIHGFVYDLSEFAKIHPGFFYI